MEFSKNQRQILEKARNVYGYKSEIIVAVEELCELSKELLKYTRYDSHEDGLKNTRKKVISEFADVTIILDHISHIFQISEYDLSDEVCGKIKRLDHWLRMSNDIAYSMQDRDCLSNECPPCFWYDHFEDLDTPEKCKNCEKDT